ncbi:MAG TPA: DM13 domain-containing protein, partial [Herpetosiphonaceae bacterium]
PTATAAPPTATPVPPTAEPEPAGPVVVSTGQFHDVDHDGYGTAIVFRNADGSYGLRFEDFYVSNGPALYVYAVAAPDAYDAATVTNAGFLDAGPLKGNKGNQNYALPAGFDPSVHRSIIIWCKRFSVNVLAAPLN